MNAEKLYHGAAYYPELRPRTEVARDIDMMLKAGFNVVRIGEFAWTKMEPHPDEFALDFFAEIIDELYAAGISTIFCTPTAAPPIWFSHGHPERMYRDEHFRTWGHGARQHACTNHPYLHERAEKISTAISSRFGKHPGLIAWQIDNEFKSHQDICCCSTCEKLWHEWLQKRFGTVDELNRRWGTEIWSQRYENFEQVPVAGDNIAIETARHNPSLTSNYRRFHHEAVNTFLELQRQALRRHSNAPITHNTAPYHHVDGESLYRNLDFSGLDLYTDDTQLASLLLQSDRYRGFKPEKKWWVTETRVVQAAWAHGFSSCHPAGFLQAQAAFLAALNCQGFLYWHWRQHSTGTEMPMSAVVNAWGTPGPGFKDVQGVSCAFRQLQPLFAESVLPPAETALIYSETANSFFTDESFQDIKYLDVMTEWEQRLLNCGLHRDVLSPSADFSGAKLLLSPHLPYMPEDFISKATEWVRNGGIWIVGPVSGIRNVDHRGHEDAAMGKNFEQLAGVETAYMLIPNTSGNRGDLLAQGNECRKTGQSSACQGSAFDETVSFKHLSCFFHLRGATSVGTITAGRGKELSFITEKNIGKGKIVLLGSMPAAEAGERLLRKMIEHYAEQAGIKHPTCSEGVLLVPRRTANGDALWFAVNLSGCKGGFSFSDSRGNAKMSEGSSDWDFLLAPYQWIVFKLNTGNECNLIMTSEHLE